MGGEAGVIEVAVLAEALEHGGDIGADGGAAFKEAAHLHAGARAAGEGANRRLVEVVGVQTPRRASFLSLLSGRTRGHGCIQFTITAGA
jgi:hypothetical protein